MKRYIILFFVMIQLMLSAQVVPTKTLRIASAFTAFGVNLSVGDHVYDINSNILYIVKNALSSSSTITLGLSNLKNVDSDTHYPYAVNSIGENGQVWKSDGYGIGYWGSDNVGTTSGVDFINWSLTDGTYIQNISILDGVVTSIGTDIMTLADLGFTGAVNANYITNNTQLTNGAGYQTTAAADSKYALISHAHSQSTRKYSTNIGDNSATSIVVTHNLGSKDVIVMVYDIATNEQIYATIILTSINTITINFLNAPTSDQYRAVIIG